MQLTCSKKEQLGSPLQQQQQLCAEEHWSSIKKGAARSSSLIKGNAQNHLKEEDM